MPILTYPAIVEGDRESGYAIYFPDLPGCVSAADSQAELMAAAREALTLHLEGMTEDGEHLPEASALESIAGDPDIVEVARILVDADIEDALVRINVSISAALLRRIDVTAEQRGMSRSSFLAESARRFMNPEADRATFKDEAVGKHLSAVVSQMNKSLYSIGSEGEIIALSDAVKGSDLFVWVANPTPEFEVAGSKTFVACKVEMKGRRKIRSADTLPGSVRES